MYLSYEQMKINMAGSRHKIKAKISGILGKRTMQAVNIGSCWMQNALMGFEYVEANCRLRRLLII